MNKGMRDGRLLLAVTGALGALCAGVAGVIAQAPSLGVLAGASGMAAGAAGIALAAGLRRSDDHIESISQELVTIRRELSAVSEMLAEATHQMTAPEADEGIDETYSAAGMEPAFDPETGLYDERYFTVLVQQQVAAARRSLRPISIVLFEVDRMHDADETSREQALAVIGDVVRRTLRESDSACRLGELMIGAILEDTSEAGAVWAAERVRGTLLASPIGDTLTVSAGVSCYPTHALGAVELVEAASVALDEARSRGRDRVELAPDA